jgi:hypothetical protein
VTSRFLTIALHSLVLAVANLGSILVGFAAYGVAGSVNQIAVQVPVAVVLTVVGFSLWLVMCHRAGQLTIDVEAAADATWIYLLAVPWAIALFTPLHFVTQGYLTSLGNIFAVVVFQGVVNIITVPVAVALVRARGAK